MSLDHSLKEAFFIALKFLLDLYEDNGHDRAKLAAIATEYKAPSTAQSKRKDRNKHRQSNQQGNNEDHIPENLFDVLPFKNDKPFARIPFIPVGISYRIKRSLTKAGVNTCFTSGSKLKDMLCSKNKTKIDSAKKPGIYKHVCPKCKKVYIGETRRCCETRWREHQCAIVKGNWSHSGISQHYQNAMNHSTFRTLKWFKPWPIRTRGNWTITWKSGKR